MIPCRHQGCGHKSPDRGGHLNHDSLHFTASVMGNPEYLMAVKDLQQAKDERAVGLEKLNSYHAHAHAEKENHGPR